ncbi:MAG: hypothetical protein C0442_10355 [Chlorobiaceae bacterium]|nr:hypothetical protein [Chlorobiaceae bacterium]
MKKIFSFVTSEIVLWFGCLFYLVLFNPYLSSHFTFCVINIVGITWCPGCGIGKSISYLLHGDIYKSFETHILGTPALILIIIRIVQLYNFKNKLKLTESYL